jgi:integrase/recombinase XerD
MANVFKVTYSKVDRKTGRRVKTKSRKWYGKFRDSAGELHRIPLCTDKEAARAMLLEAAQRAERRIAGISHPSDDHAQEAMGVHIERFEGSLRAKDDADRHVKLTIARITAICDGCKFRRIPHIRASSVSEWLTDRREEGMGISTANGYLVAMKSFCQWLVRDNRSRENRLSHLSRLNEDVDIRRERRALDQTEFANLLAVTLKSRIEYRGLTGVDRAVLYLVAAYSGLRASELASLVARSFNLDGPAPTVTVKAGYSKRRRLDVVPLRIDVAFTVKKWMEQQTGMEAGEHLWPGTWFERAAEMLQADLKDAGIEYEDDQGRVFDFHALRHQFISNLVLAGVHPKVAQQLARHSTITLTMDRYAHVPTANVMNALEQLTAPDLSLIPYVPRYVPENDFSGQPVAFPGIGATSKGQKARRRKSLPAAALDTSCHVATPLGKNGAAGTRTQNQQIMSLLL